MACNSKTADRRAKRMEIWDLGTLVRTMGCIWPCMVQGNLGVIWYTCLKMACNSKMAGRYIASVYREHLLHSLSIQGRFGHSFKCQIYD